MKSFTYDKANQLVTSTDNKVTNYAYDAAERLVKEGDKTYSYGYLDSAFVDALTAVGAISSTMNSVNNLITSG